MVTLELNGKGRHHDNQEKGSAMFDLRSRRSNFDYVNGSYDDRQRAEPRDLEHKLSEVSAGIQAKAST